jgi:hypothetical protein
MDQGNENKSQLSSLGTVTFSLGTGLVLGGLYLYSLFSGKDENIHITDPNSEIKDDTDKQRMSLGKAVYILHQIHRRTEKYVKEERPEIDRKIEFFDKPNEYEKLCTQLYNIKCKMTEIVLKEKGFTEDELNRVIESIDPVELMRKILDKENFNIEMLIFDRNLLKKAFRYYAEKLIEEIKNFQQQMNNTGENTSTNKYNHFKINMIKYRIDDDLLQNFYINERILRRYVFYYNLMNEPEIKRLLNEIAIYETIFLK